MTKIHTREIRLAAAILFLAGVLLLVVAGCGDTGETSSSKAGSATTSASLSPEDRAARLAAQSQLRNAQMAQETFFVNNERYASSTNELKAEDAGLSAKVQVTKGDATTYELQITASDSGNTVFILRKTGTRIERVDSNGDSW